MKGNGKGSSYSIAERSVPGLIPVLGSQPAGDVIRYDTIRDASLTCARKPT